MHMHLTQIFLLQDGGRCVCKGRVIVCLHKGAHKPKAALFAAWLQAGHVKHVMKAFTLRL